MNTGTKPMFKRSHRSFSEERILIVTEDTVVEPEYFNMLADKLKVDMNVRVEEEGFTDPLQLVRTVVSHRVCSSSRQAPSRAAVDGRPCTAHGGYATDVLRSLTL